MVDLDFDLELALNAVAVLLILLGLASWIQGLLFLAGVCFLLFSFTLYLRETRT